MNEEKNKLIELEEITKEVVRWCRENCDPYQQVVISCSEVKVMRTEMYCPATSV